MHFGRSCCIRHQATLRTKEIKTSDWLLQGTESKKKTRDSYKSRASLSFICWGKENGKCYCKDCRSRVNIINSVRITYRSYRSSARPSAHHRLSEACVKLSLDLLHLSSSSSFTLMQQSQLSLMNNSFFRYCWVQVFFLFLHTSNDE